MEKAYDWLLTALGVGCLVLGQVVTGIEVAAVGLTILGFLLIAVSRRLTLRMIAGTIILTGLVSIFIFGHTFYGIGLIAAGIAVGLAALAGVKTNYDNWGL